MLRSILNKLYRCFECKGEDKFCLMCYSDVEYLNIFFFRFCIKILCLGNM